VLQTALIKNVLKKCQKLKNDQPTWMSRLEFELYLEFNELKDLAKYS